MGLIQLLVILCAIGILVWAINKYGSPFIDGKFIQIINIVAVVGTIIWLLNIFGVFQMADIHIGK